MGSGLENALGVERFVVLRQDENARLRTNPQALADEIGTVTPTQHQIEQGDIRIFRRQPAERFGYRSCFAAYLETLCLLEHRPHAHAYDGMIVDDQDTRHARLITTDLRKTGAIHNRFALARDATSGRGIEPEESLACKLDAARALARPSPNGPKTAGPAAVVIAAAAADTDVD
jgi:hypothetical protein